MPYNPDAVRVLRHRDTLSGSPGSSIRTVIGTYLLAEDTTFRKGYEVAAWWTDILVPAGEYDITTNGYWAFVRLPGVIVSEYTPSLFGGVAYGGEPQREQHRDVGNACTKHMQMYLYDVAARMADPESDMRPLPHVEPVLTSWVEHSHINSYTGVLDVWPASAMFGIVIHEADDAAA